MGDDYDSQVAAALAASQNEANSGSSGGWVRKEVPLDVVQSEQVFERSDNLFGLMRVLFREEQSTFRRAVTNSSDQCVEPGVMFADCAMIVHLQGYLCHTDCIQTAYRLRPLVPSCSDFTSVPAGLAASTPSRPFTLVPRTNSTCASLLSSS